MKTRIFNVSISLIFLIFVTINAFCEDEYVPTENEEIYGTWINPDYNDVDRAGKLIFNADGIIDQFKRIHDDDPVPWEYTIIDKWTDSQGNILYKIFTIMKIRTRHEPFYELYKINNSGSSLEMAQQLLNYPKDVNPNTRGQKYHIYYRQ